MEPPKTIDLRKKMAPIPESDFKIRTEPKTDDGSKVPLPNIIESAEAEFLSWNGPLGYHNPDRKLVWIVSVSFLVIAALFQIFQKNITTTAFIALVAVMIFVRSRKGPVWGTVEISPLGVKIDGVAYTRKDIKSFWIEYDTASDVNVKELILHLKKWHMPYIRIPLTDQNPVQIRSILIKFIPEVEYEQTFTDILARRLGL